MKIKAIDSDLLSIVGRIKNEIIDLQPDFQRGDVWSPQKQKRLIDSILREWQVPPVHVIKTEEFSHEVLDGQQRLRSVFNFFNNKFKVNGKLEPIDESLSEIDGMYYKNLPTKWKSIVDFYTIRVLEISDYKPGETGELFNRLNQSLNLTAAEKRNAQVGVTRAQIKAISNTMANFKLDNKFIGFSNTRLAYDDLFARLCAYLEKNDVRAKISDTDLYERYRQAIPYTQKIIDTVKFSLELVSEIKEKLETNGQNVHITKATFFSWLFFIGSMKLNFEDDFDRQRVSDCFYLMEMLRYNFKNNIDSDFDWSGFKANKDNIFSLFSLFNERASSRVMTTSSLLIREWCIALFYYFEKNNFSCLSKLHEEELKKILKTLNDDRHDTKMVIETLAENGACDD